MKWFKITKDKLLNLDNAIFIEKDGLCGIKVHHTKGSSSVEFHTEKFRDEQFEWIVCKLLFTEDE